MREYIICRTEAKPNWDAIEPAEILQCPWETFPKCYPAFAQVCAGKDRFFARLYAQESNPIAVHHALNSFVCKDSCLEFFLQPSLESPLYFNFEFNCEGTMYLGMGEDRYSNVKLYPEDYRNLFQVCTQIDPQGWSVEFTIPHGFIKQYIPCWTSENPVMRGNFYKCGDETPVPHFQCWSYVNAAQPDFHRPEYFGILRLDKAK